MKDNHIADVSHTDEFDRMYQEMVKQAEDKYKVKSEHPKTEEETKPKYEDEVNGEYYSTPKYLVRPSGYQFVDENGNVINATKIVLEKKKEYPKDYLECCEVMYKNPVENYGKCIVKINDGYKGYEIQTLQKLIFCRDAYWKIAGEEMGLGKPWKPDWEGEGWYVIVNHRGDIVTDIQWHANAILAFPTVEMRDAFYENFKEEIEQCKELL